jgi:hypothetical protein
MSASVSVSNNSPSPLLILAFSMRKFRTFTFISVTFDSNSWVQDLLLAMAWTGQISLLWRLLIFQPCKCNIVVFTAVFVLLSPYTYHNLAVKLHNALIYAVKFKKLFIVFCHSGSVDTYRFTELLHVSVRIILFSLHAFWQEMIYHHGLLKSLRCVVRCILCTVWHSILLSSVTLCYQGFCLSVMSIT